MPPTAARPATVASQGAVAFYAGDERVGECTAAMRLTAPKSATPYAEIERTIRACGADAVMRVDDVR